MTWYLTGLALLLQIYFWGAGLTVFLLPTRWRPFWPAFCPYVGLALQSALVWTAARTPLPGTDSYALVSTLLPAGLLLAAGRRLGGLRPALELLGKGGLRWWGLWLAMAVCFSLVVYPFTKPPGVLTSIAMGSCDSADYAAGARTFKEFAATDRSGFIGLTEVVQLLSVTTFYDFWLRLNHFTPSAILALNGSLLGCQPHELASLLGVVFLALNLPALWWLARAGFGLRPAGATLVALLYGLNPILLYAVYQTALGQLIAAPAVALLIWVGLQAWRGPGTLRHFWRYSGLLLLVHWLILGSYNFIILFCYAPLVAYIGARAWLWREWRPALRWAGFIVSGLLLCLFLFPGRLTSIEERLQLFTETSFGWQLPPFAPEGWYGLLDNERLWAASGGFPKSLGILCLLALAAAAWRLWRAGGRSGRRALGLAAACALPAFAGYSVLLWWASLQEDNSSYNAFKLFCVFYPATITSLCLWLRPVVRRGGPGVRVLPAMTATGPVRRRWALPGSKWPWRYLPRGEMAWRVAATGLALVLLAAVYRRNTPFAGAIRRTGLVVDEALCTLRDAEQKPIVSSINVLLAGYWPRLWANYFLLRKPQYFAQRTYEGRRVTPLRGQWDLRDSFLTVHPPTPGDYVELSAPYYLLDRRGEWFLGMSFANGWYAPEHRKDENWCWAGENPRILVENPRTFPVWATMRFAARSLNERTVRINTNTGGPPHPLKLGVAVRVFNNIPVRLPPGRSHLTLETPEPGVTSPGDNRLLTIALYQLRLDILEAPPAAPRAD